MAIMIPAECDLTQRPISEQKVFELLQSQLSDNWFVFHSFDYVARNKNKKRWDGEIDFLLYHPKKGFLVLEVKGGVISYRDNLWYQEDRLIDPFKQAQRNKYAVRNLLQYSLRKKAMPLPFAHAVCFPDCGNQANWPAEAQGIVLTGNHLAFLPAIVNKLIHDVEPPKTTELPPAKEEVLQILSPYFECGTSLAERIESEKRHFSSLTRQQYALLDALQDFKRLHFVGSAGTGKTVLALKKAHQLAAEGKTVLLLCFNHLLADFLQKETETANNITAAAFFEYCIELLKIPESEVEKYRTHPKLYSEVLPALLKKYILSRCLCYDAVIVDEGQDFTQAVWEVISMLPVEDGEFYIFYDPAQTIFTEKEALPDFGVPPVRLSTNCRNTRKISEAMRPFQTIDSCVPPYAPEGADIRLLAGSGRQQLEEELERLVMKNNIPLKDIVILTGHSLQNTSLGNDPKVGRFTLVNSQNLQPLEVSCFTYMKFKGCESKVVILLDVDEKDPRWTGNGLYTAMSRAVHQLIILKKEQ